MQRFPSLADKANTHLPDNYHAGHELCFVIHDIMVELLNSGIKASVFNVRFEFRDETDRLAFLEAENAFEWLEQTRRIDEREVLLVTTVFPALLGDALQYFYEALETSRKGKLSVTYSLLRKPLQESLFLFELMIADQANFADKLVADPPTLGSRKAGGVEAHAKRIQKVLDILEAGDDFDANYLAQLRYEKTEDGFDGICNKATHLFTSHDAICTEPLNINFIFSTNESRLTQWSFLYSRLPYLLLYIYRIVEDVFAAIVTTDPAYLDDMKRRIYAHVLLWWETIEARYAEPRLNRLVLKMRDWLCDHCQAAGYRLPDRGDLISMAETGNYPG